MLLFITLFSLFLFYFLGFFQFAFIKLGFTPWQALSFLFLSLFGSLINIPVKRIVSKQPILTFKTVKFFFVEYQVPVLVEGTRETVVAVNVGGAIIPTLVSIWLLLKITDLILLIKVLATLVVVTLIVHSVAKPVQGLGIAVPSFIPPISSALLSMLIAPNQAPVVAYISGTLGALIGADILNLNKIPELGASVASIGGAGTFDGVFLSGVLAVLLTI